MNAPDPAPHAARTEERLAHASALQLLGEVRDYLARLPVVPATRHQVAKIDAFLASPQSRVAQARADDALRLAETRVGGMYSPVGAPLLVAQVRAEMLTLAGPLFQPITDREAQFGALTHTVLLPAVQLELAPADLLQLEFLPKGP